MKNKLYLFLLLLASGMTAQKTLVATTGEKSSLTATVLGLSNVNNTSDVNKPISTAQQAALDLKVKTVNPVFTGAPTAPTAAAGTNTDQIATTAFVDGVINSKMGVFQSSAPPTNTLGNVGDMYIQTDGTNTTIWYKLVISGVARWVSKTSMI